MDSHDDQSLATAATAAHGQLEINAVDEALAAAGARRCNDSDTITASNDDLSQEEGNNEEITPPIDMKGNEETIHEEIEGDIVIGNEEKRHDEIDANIVIQVAPPPVLGGQETYPGACRIIPVNLGNTEGDPSTTTPAVSLSEARSSALNALTNDEEAGSLTSAGHCQQPDDVDDQLDRLGVHRVEAEAVPVEDVDIAYAKPIKTVNVFGKEIQSTNLKWLACLSLIAIVSIVTPAAIAVANRKDDNPAELVEQSNNDSPKKHQGRGRIFDIIFPISPAVAINDPTSPQKQAIHWMVSEDDFPYNNTGRADRWIQERYILAVIWFDTGGATWTRDGGIVGWDDHCNSTEMIVCNDDSHVVELSFGNSNLSGTIPSEIQHLSLQRLSLEKNEYLGGTLPQFNVVDLQRLWVQETNVTGSLDFPSQSCEGGDFMADLKNVDCECCVCSFTVFATVFSMPGVVAAHEIFFEDKYCDSCTPWHVKAAYIALAILLPSSLAFVLALPNATNLGDSDQDPSDEGQELPTLGQQSDSETVAKMKRHQTFTWRRKRESLRRLQRSLSLGKRPLMMTDGCEDSDPPSRSKPIKKKLDD